jgi:hypothetical protein
MDETALFSGYKSQRTKGYKKKKNLGTRKSQAERLKKPGKTEGKRDKKRATNGRKQRTQETGGD